LRSGCGVALAVLTTCVVSSLVVGSSQPTFTSTIVADCLPEFDPSKPCLLAALRADYQVGFDGLCKRVASGERPTEIRLPLPKNARIDRVLYGEFQGDLLLIYEISDGESGWGAIVRLAPRSLVVKWHVNLPGFNLSKGTIEGSRLYQAGFGFVGAIDLTRGTFVWKHSGLYDRPRQSFNAFQPPEPAGREVIFREEPVSHTTNPPRVIRVNKVTGKMTVQ
jgi:hypothetical protein